MFYSCVWTMLYGPPPAPRLVIFGWKLESLNNVAVLEIGVSLLIRVFCFVVPLFLFRLFWINSVGSVLCRVRPPKSVWVALWFKIFLNLKTYLMFLYVCWGAKSVTWQLHFGLHFHPMQSIQVVTLRWELGPSQVLRGSWDCHSFSY